MPSSYFGRGREFDYNRALILENIPIFLVQKSKNLEQNMIYSKIWYFLCLSVSLFGPEFLYEVSYVLPEIGHFQQKVIDYASTPGVYPVLLFPEGFCSNMTTVLQFRKAVFTGEVPVYPIAVSQNARYPRLPPSPS